MKNIIITIIAALTVCAVYAQSKTPAFKPNAAIEKKISSFRFDTLKNFTDTRNDDPLKATYYCFKVVDITFEDGIVPVWEPVTNSKRFIGCKIRFKDSEGAEFGTVWAIKKSSKEGVWFSDFKKGKKKLWAAKIFKPLKLENEQFPVNTETNFKDFISEDEYKKSSLFQSDEKKDSEPLKVSETSVPMFCADMTIKSVVCVANVELDDYYNYTFRECKDTHWSLAISALNDDGTISKHLQGYIPKNTEQGRKAKDMLKDGKKHNCLIKVKHSVGENEPEFVLVERIEEIKSKE